MDWHWQRRGLIAAIIFVLILLLREWTIFQETLVAQNFDDTTLSASASQSPAPTQINTDSASDLPVATEPTIGNNADVPDLAEPEFKPIESTTNTEQLITVTTDSLSITIDTLGGDIVKAALPKYYEAINEPDKPFILLNRTASHLYISQSGLIGPNGTDGSSRPVFSTQQTNYVMDEGQDVLNVDLYFQQEAVAITKRFIFKRDTNAIKIEYLINNQSAETWRGNLYGQIKRDGKNPPITTNSAMGVRPYLGSAITTPDKNYRKIEFDEFQKLNESGEKFEIKGGWVAMIQHYFLSAWIPNAEDVNSFKLRESNSQQYYLMGFTGPRVEIPAGESGTLSARFYVGPKNIEQLEKLSQHLDLTVDYGWLWMISKPLFLFLKGIHDFVGNWGWSIILLTMLIKLAFFKLSATSYRSMANMRKLTPKIQDLKERFGEDRQRMSQEMMKLYKKEKINPLSGCLPILIQMPVFLALYWVLMESVELRHAPFVLWIEDLSVKDPVFILPLIMGATMWFQQKLSPAPPDPMQAKVMQMMPIFFTVMFLFFPAGLVLYWVVNNSLSILQQYIITKKIESTA